MNKDIMKQTGFEKEVEDVENGICPICKGVIDMNDFRDEVSRMEFSISGLCQSCQDEFFDENADDN
jgi:hypothetical protein